MNIRPVVASVVGQVTDERWGQVLQTPHAYGVVEIYSSVGIARQRGIHILTELTQAFATPPVSLAGLAAVADAVSRNEDIVSLILLVPVGATLYIVSRGKGRVYLKRDVKLAMLLDDSQSLSGDVQEGDVIIAATSGFVRTLTSTELIGVFDHLSPVEVAEKLTMRLHEKDGGEGGAALIFHIEKQKEERVEQEIVSEMSAKPAPIAPSIRFRRVKAFGRKVTTIRQRRALRKFTSMVFKFPALAPKRLVAYIVAFLFLASVLLGIRQSRVSETKSAMSETIKEAQHSFNEGMALLDLNPVKGRERLTEAQALLEPLVARKLKTEEGKNAERLFAEVADNLTRAMHIVRVSPELFFDMSLLKKGAVAVDVSLFGDVIAALDSGGKTVFTLGISNKNGKIVGGGAPLSDAKHIAMYGDKIYVWTPKGIHMVRLTDEKTVANAIPVSSEWGVISDMISFGGNIYLLDTQKSRIWKYVATEKGFSDVFEYLNPDTLPDLSQTTNMAIDGSVWLGTSIGSIVRFTSGQSHTYTPQGEDTPLGSNLAVYTNDETEMLYVLDSDHNRIMVFDKDGLYMSQYMWENGLPVQKIVVSETQQKIFLLAGGKLYETPLR